MQTRDTEQLFWLVASGAICGLAIAWLVLCIFFYLALYRCLDRVRQSDRDMDPPMVWLNLIPVFMIVWTFFTVYRIGSSLRKEFQSREWPVEGERFGTTVGTAYAVLLAVSHIPYLGQVFLVPMLVCQIVYWMQMARYSARLTAKPDRRRDIGEDDDLLETPPPPRVLPPAGEGTAPEERIRRID